MMNLPSSSRRMMQRHRAEVRVYVVTPDGLQACRTRDISREGAFLETDYRGFLSGETITLVFPFARGNLVRLRRYPAVVVRYAYRGVGLQFCRPIETAVVG
jgi:hypothetical protein